MLTVLWAKYTTHIIAAYWLLLLPIYITHMTYYYYIYNITCAYTYIHYYYYCYYYAYTYIIYTCVNICICIHIITEHIISISHIYTCTWPPLSILNIEHWATFFLTYLYCGRYLYHIYIDIYLICIHFI
jgi:hypothetical protein